MEENIIKMLKLLKEKHTSSTHPAISTNENRGKSLDLAEQSRKNGNKLFISSHSLEDFQNVYACYARSIAHAPAGSQEMALSYSNLSAVLLRMKQYPECVQAIDLCLSSGYPEKAKLKIYLRKIECLKILGEQLEVKKTYDETVTWIEKNGTEGEKKRMKKTLEDYYRKQVEVRKRFTEEEFDKVWDKFSIQSRNKEIPDASSAIELRYSDSQGRYFVATRDIRPGEILLKEQPYVVACSNECRYFSCWECLRVATNCIPCDVCENVIFCSVKCKEDAWKKYHHVECQVLPFIYESPQLVVSHVVVAFKMLLLAINEYGSIQKLRKAVQEMDKSKKDPRTAGFTCGKLLANKYAGIHSLTMKENNRCPIFLAADTIHYAVTKTTFGDSFKADSENMHEDEDAHFAIRLLVEHMKKINRNSFSAGVSFASRPTTGTCLLTAGSLFNHSCFPNANVKVAMPYTETFAVLPIKKGEEICIDYTGGKDMPKEVRQAKLQFQHEFVCNCVACVNNWPVPSQYPNMHSLPARYGSILKTALMTAISIGSKIEEMEIVNYNQRNYKSMTKILDQLSDLIDMLFTRVPMPCDEIMDVQLILIKLFKTMRVSYY